jgi:glutathione S-transferase
LPAPKRCVIFCTAAGSRRGDYMAHYKLYCIGASGNSYKVALYLNCAGLDWAPVGIDFAGGVQRDANWRAEHNAMGEVPVMEVAGQRMSQSGAILTWLAETTGHFAPPIAALRGAALDPV